MRIVCFALLALGLAASTGCARYEYQLVQPAELSQHVGRKADAVIDVDPLQYRLRTVENRLVMRIYNPTEEPIELLGTKSTVVDPEGQSHPLRGQSIAANSFIRVILPPMRPRVYDYGPRWGVGLGVGYRVRAHHHHYYPYPGYWHYPYMLPYPYWYDPFYDYGYGPRYLAVVDDGDGYYWDWRGEGAARVVLVYRRGEEEFRHEFTFRRHKV